MLDTVTRLGRVGVLETYPCWKSNWKKFRDLFGHRKIILAWGIVKSLYALGLGQA
jgi:hypothetical protein